VCAQLSDVLVACTHINAQRQDPLYMSCSDTTTGRHHLSMLIRQGAPTCCQPWAQDSSPGRPLPLGVTLTPRMGGTGGLGAVCPATALHKGSRGIKRAENYDHCWHDIQAHYCSQQRLKLLTSRHPTSSWCDLLSACGLHV
jgi:hypothetical protein